ncbi:tumor susceptibility gene 101 protein [Bombus vosnesenskii]|uniref:Tumor susceptibility gene 101 protein n=3 Tax=Pyrobombus TaxID=144703 RepID=A0A6J3K9G9_9HYME|nr:tumor susceptibility gene 101 protein [Bombus impatiens]XP_012238329.1 tumor susceptibility gene 101 protein [Bombus impatiens]XP_033175530.1 tumor susceptibility gene 101 protein [Bombus impatiens]XP_033183068.1 tumor susceptibility gene 101 protein [Bombus vancouverensis nearcticus]XP_033183069.1 tumor susceptibility gene 101 protein [Bombus vancouverensis nearcticus]XP_033183070.1 tumor susceptibility gene 101 protein [Bombus vancouverensis nearcticus]XP_033297772.1 tumor susceptibility
MVKMTSLDEGKIKQSLSKYQNADITKKHVMKVLSLYKGLKYNVEPFVFNDGSRKELFNLQGTIPVSFKGTYYNIPICIWLMDTHPNNAPMCYVKPTADMDIKVSMFVDHNGKIYLPYLHDWVPHSSDLLSLIQIMIVTFGDQPPVYAKPRQGIQTSSTPYPVQPFMPVPGSGTHIPGSNFPPYPQNSQYPGGSNIYSPYMSTTSSGFPYQGSYGSYGGSASNYPSQGCTGSFPYPPSTQPSPTVPATAGASGTITEEHIRASLLSAVEDKLRRRLKEQFSQLVAELETLRRTQQELTSGFTHLTDLFERLKKEKAELEKNITILQDKEAELEKEIAKLSDNQSIDVDEAVTTIAPLYKQMLNAFAEEAATEDAIYYLGEALRCGIIDLDAFLKQVRQLSRRQFMLRALMQRCRQKAGLAG